jgi:SAM-dependent methyltransferase
MKFKLKKFIGNFPILVKSVRFARRIKPVWRETSLSLEQEARYQDRLVSRQQVIDEYLASSPVKKLQVGAGTNFLRGWLNTDYEPITDGVIFLDARQPFPFKDGVFDYVFSEHMLEHIPYKEGIFMMKELFRVLKPGGKVRIATPDIEKIVGLYSMNKTEEQDQYIEWKATEHMGLYSPQKSKLQERRSEWDIDYEHIRQYYPDPKADGVCFIVNQFFRGYGHQFLYDLNSLRAIMLEAGFENIHPCEPGQSGDEHLRGVESHAKLIGDSMNDFETMVVEGDRK